MAVVVALVLLVAAASASAVDRTLLCSQKAETGLCRAYIPSFFYNSESGKCERFIYGGCGGNDNRFDSEEDCHATCAGVQLDSDVDTEVLCSQEPETGFCMAYFPSFYYNPKTGTCESFVYGGCGGNSNRFATKEACHAVCGAVQKSPAVDTEVLCAQEAETGPCRAYFPSYYYNAKSGSCESFVYGGCGGNANRFASKESCHATCGAVQPEIQRSSSLPKEVLCAQEAVTGMCMAYIPSFFYNIQTGKCESFIYGGCQGNENRFATEAECHSTCAGVGQTKVEDKQVLCSQKAETGFCRAYFPSYYYNIETGKCEFFVYGGCGGNTNRFNSEDECHATCAGVEPEFHNVKNCFLEARTGPCKNNVQRYFFNRSKGQCEEFTYGGCDGNKNNWASQKDCEDHCLMV